MKIKLKSNRSFLVKAFLPFAIAIPFFLILWLISLIINYEQVKNSVWHMLVLFAVEVVIICLILFAKYYKGKSYEFTENEILVYKKGKNIDQIYVSEIERISYYPFKLRYIITIFAGALNEGGAWKLHVKMKNGNKQELAFFALSDVKKLKEVYGDLIVIN